jgi:hypothetical protein
MKVSLTVLSGGRGEFYCRQGYPPHDQKLLTYDGSARKDPSYPTSRSNSVHSNYKMQDWHYDLCDCCVEPCLCTLFVKFIPAAAFLAVANNSPFSAARSIDFPLGDMFVVHSGPHT